MNVFEQSKWIWACEATGNNAHAEFYGEFAWEDGEVICRLSCDSDYTLYVNDVAVASNQYGDYEHFKSYDVIALTGYLKVGINRFAVHVWHHGTPCFRYASAPAGLIFEVVSNEKYILVSDENIIGRKSRVYVSGLTHMITPQLGHSFCYDANAEDKWRIGKADGFTSCICVEKHCSFVERPNEKLIFTGKAESKIVESGAGKKHYIVDLQRESVGVPMLSLFSSTENNRILVSFGELLENGRVKRFIGPRDFSFVYIAKAGQNDFTHYCLRLGCRYLELYCDAPIDLQYAGVILQEYPVEIRRVCIENDFDRKMYDLSVRSLKLCMMEHYVDCPWREQSLYAFDSRNQMLFGYYAFKQGNTRYVRSNLELYGKSKLISGIFPICAPCEMELCIPSFALHYFVGLKEYTDYSGDNTLALELYPTLCKVMDFFLQNRRNGLMYTWEDAKYWNFYDWSLYMDGVIDGVIGAKETPVPDVMINILTVMALQALKVLCEKTKQEYPYAGIREELIANIRKNFFVEEDGLFTMKIGERIYTQLVNSMAILNGLTTQSEAERICEKLYKGQMHASAMSMNVFKYDALLQTDEARYKDYVIDDMRKDFKVMFDAGATSTWETIEGAAAFENAGSLCHGWTALPVYYFHRLGIAKYQE